MSNFEFMNSLWPELANTLKLAERYLYSDPNASLFKMRSSAEQLLDLVLVTIGQKTDSKLSQYEKLELLKKSNENTAILNLFDYIRRMGNMAAHENYNSQNAAKKSLENIFRITCWVFVRVTGDYNALPIEFQLPEKSSNASTENQQSKEELERIKKEYEKEINELKGKYKQIRRDDESQRRVIDKVTNKLNLTEAETRKQLIDVMLQEAGWRVDDEEQLVPEYKVTGYPSPSGKGLIDYVLFDRKGNPIALIEAKKTSRDPEDGRVQAKLYADCLEKMHGIRPIIFYTNGFEIWIWDDKVSQPRELWGMYSLEDLEFLMFQRDNKLPLVNAKIDHEIAGRPYQIEGIKRVFEKYQSGKRRSLMVMATGSGKTRTAIALVKGMIATKWVKRVLFLADRDELVDQAMQGSSSFKTFLPETTRVRVSSKTHEDRSKSIYFSTYNAMKNYYFNFSVGFFDLIIVDESHRSIYKSYREIIEYFDAYIIGLTATPVNFIDRNTFDLFDDPAGDPTFLFSYDEAKEHVPPYLLDYKAKDATTQFMRKGIKWSELTEKQQKELIEAGYSEDNINFDKDALDKFVVNKETTQYILRTLMTEGIKVGDTVGKSIIFARNIGHAKRLIKEFDKMYPQYKGKLATIVHSGLGKTQSKAALSAFRYEDRPRIAISVDMLDTGIDVPEVVNLVFAKPIYSKVKFLQMIGRGTRLSKDLFGKGRDKEYFLIIDHWKNFDFFDINPEGLVGNVTKNPLQIRFELRVNLMNTLKKCKMNDQMSEMINLIRSDVAALPERSIEVRKKRKTLEKLKNESVWKFIPKELTEVLENEIAPLMQWIDTQGEQEAIWFDNEMYRMQIAKLIKDYPKVSSKADRLIGEFSRLRVELNQFEGKREYITKWINEEQWIKSNYDEIEECRVLLRDLMKYRGEGLSRGFVELNLTDTDSIIKEVKNPSVSDIYNMDKYLIRVKEALESELDLQLVIKKIRKGLALTEVDFQIIHFILENKELDINIVELSEKAKVSSNDIQSLLRKVVGVDEEEINNRFQQFIHKYNHVMSASQIKILDMIKSDIIKNRGISFASLYEPPYTSISKEGIDGLFNEIMTDEIFAMIDPYKIEVGENFA
ncbi:DEAD/DEAH box helicase family protein [Bacillus sp. ISL-37]|uniref:DEAD/DEAH box helicase family protein n=1 Tax=Bacillus sp. ISL-37 TaxID=2819123 RepID=UPI001BE843DF|nr:DEAD/DEAH box helicase family protein [Bacillus sp. ISL-37]MBT2685313.1 DEAD/DEAH box helicase family protein [Bacillus sp. ISL-37]